MRPAPKQRLKIRDRERTPVAIFVKAVVIAMMLGGCVWYVLQRGRMFMTLDCRVLYGMAESAADSARVDRTRVPQGYMPHWVTCGEIRVDNWPPFAEQPAPLGTPPLVGRPLPTMRSAGGSGRDTTGT